MTIADAPWIREAENDGWGPAGDDPDYSEQVEKLKNVEELLAQAEDWLLEVEDDLNPGTVENFYREQMDAIQNIECDIRIQRKNLERGYLE